MSKAEDSDDDWFNKDEEDLVKDSKAKVEEAKNEVETTEEHIEAILLHDAQPFRSDTRKPQDLPPKIPTADLRKLAKTGDALEAFLYAFTQENPDFFLGQIHMNDAMERVFLYTRIFVMIIELKIPGFHTKTMKYFVQNEELFDIIELIATKMFTKRYKSLWKTDSDKATLDRFISDIQILFLQAYKLNILEPKVLTTMQHIKRLLEISDYKEIISRVSFLELAKNLAEILNDENKAVSLKAANDIYPNLDELLNEESITDKIVSSLVFYDYKSVNEYLQIQQRALRYDFISVLSFCIKELKENHCLNSALAEHVFLYKNVEIILNENFVEAQRHEMLFVDVLSNPTMTKEKKKELKMKLQSIKTGSLICFTTSYDFDDLILALVTHQIAEYSQHGYIAIEIVRQFNIGNIYNKKFIMFSSPAFFEPYNNVYNYLSTCSIDDFPMKELIVFGKTDDTPPNYMNDKTIYHFDKHQFKPLQEPPPKNLPLNKSQSEALQKALTQKFTLIQGPPGTGKTHLSVQLVKLLLENETPKPIVVVAYTNESLDKFLLKISAFTSSIARFGGQTRSHEIAKFNVNNPSKDIAHPRLKRLYFIINTEYKKAFEKLQFVQREFDGTDDGYEKVLLAQRKVQFLTEQLNTIRSLFRYYVVREHSIVALTTTCAAKMNFLFRLLNCKIVIFEEAAEILESHVLSALTPFTEHVIMIGDHMQLKPYTSNYQHSRSCQLNVSLFERLIIRDILSPTPLLTQYRMRPIIAKLMSPIFYDVLRNNDNVERYPPVKGMHENLFFLTHNEAESQFKQTPSICNFYELHKIIELAVYLIKEAKYKQKDIVILTPYIRQCNGFVKTLPSHLKSIRCMTVDSFQGLEAKIVLLSLVRNNDKGQIGFLKEKNRICVSLSRAKHGLYIIGNLQLLSSCSRVWQEIEQKLKAHDLIGSSFPYEKKFGNEIDIKFDIQIDSDDEDF